MPPLRRAGRRLAIALAIATAAIALPIAGIVLHHHLTPHHTVLIDNGNPFAVDLDVGGERVHLAPYSTAEVRAHDGRLAVTATGPSGFREELALELPATGLRDAGRIALYNVGGASRLAVVAIAYGTVLDAGVPPVSLLPPAGRLVLLPPGVAGSIDQPFPREVRTKRWGAVLQHVCHADPASHRLGCPGANAGDD